MLREGALRDSRNLVFFDHSQYWASSPKKPKEVKMTAPTFKNNSAKVKNKKTLIMNEHYVKIIFL